MCYLLVSGALELKFLHEWIQYHMSHSQMPILELVPEYRGSLSLNRFSRILVTQWHALAARVHRKAIVGTIMKAAEDASRD